MEMNFNGEEWWNNQVHESDEWKELGAWISKEIIENQDVDDMDRFPGAVLPDVAEMVNKATHVATNFSTLSPLSQLFQINPSEIQEGFLQDYQVTDITSPLITNTNYHASDDDDDEGKIGANDKKRIRLTDNQNVMPSSSCQTSAAARNFNERKRRRDINNKIKALHDLVPVCQKTSKECMLDEIYNYIKYLQLQLQKLCLLTGKGR
ncbi:hypothetical protein ZOSMA_177G00200 [Zostera marina]|uniref:BHLH domain-containing protein n=1 Tax=Zostera marina TaxID=29655 RepID=A0A0K9PTY5_ZOSMR|nr:hypothetical protein ZOSMA_177G00200 [Zostera marina]